MANDEKPTKRTSPLHDNPRSREKVTETKKVTERESEPEEKKEPEPAPNGDSEPRNEKGQTQGEERDDVSDKSPTGEGAEAPAGSPDAAMKDKFLEGLKMIQKRHETERMEHHGQMREAHRTMGRRHNKEIADHFDLHFGEGGGDDEPEKKPAAKAE